MSVDFGYMYDEQLKFFTSKARYKAFVGGFGSGKTHVGHNFVAYNHFYKKSPKTGKSNGWVLYPNLKLADELFTVPFLEKLDNIGLPYHHDKKYNRIKTHFGTIAIYTMERPNEMVGSELTYCYADEFDVARHSNCKIVFKKIKGRLRGCNDAQFGTTTTPEGFKETYESFVKKPFKKFFFSAS